MGDELRFGVVVLQEAPLPELVERWQLLEDMGFDDLYVCDHTADYRDQRGYWLDGWTVLAAMAAATARVRIGTLVSNPILRHPAMLAKAAVAVDHVSGGRLELGIGTGIAGFDHAATGTPYWSIKERLARFAEYVEIVDGVLRSDGAYTFAGRYLSSENTAMNPGPLQRPRPPITLAGQSPTVLKVAARRADCWNTHGPFGAGGDEILELTARQNRTLDKLCEEKGRDPREVRRSLLLLGPLDAWSSADAFETVVSRFVEAGVREFVAFWPPEDRRGLLERAANHVIPDLRG